MQSENLNYNQTEPTHRLVAASRPSLCGMGHGAWSVGEVQEFADPKQY
jgi:hypothetical protein